MDPKADALKRLKIKSPLHNMNAVKPIATEKKDDDDNGDLAPSIGEKKPLISSELTPEHAPVMEGLANSVSHSGFGARSLDGKASDIAKEKMASIMKHKK